MVASWPLVWSRGRLERLKMAMDMITTLGLKYMLFFSLQDVLVKVIRQEGFFSLWKGFTPYYARLGPHTVLTFIFLEQMNKYYTKLVLKSDVVSGGL